MFKRVMFLVSVLFLITVTPINSQAEKKGPKEVSQKAPAAVSEIKFEARKYDFGEIEQGTVVTHLFKFQNKGKGTLVINKVKTSCGCTAALLSSKVLKPGEDGEIKATFNSGRFRGAIKKTVYVHSNDPKEPVIQLRLVGKIKPRQKEEKKKKG